MADPRRTIWVLGDQLSRRSAAFNEVTPSSHRVLMVESTAKLSGRRWHVQRAHFVVTSMRRFAAELESEGFTVDYRQASSLAEGFKAHCEHYSPRSVLTMEPASRSGLRLMEQLAVEVAPSDQFLCHRNDFAQWAEGRQRFKMEDFYRFQRRRLGYLMDGDEPAGGAWNFDADNRQPPPKDGHDRWPAPLRDELDHLDHQVLGALPATWGAPPDGTWATSRAGALRRLDHFVNALLPMFGPHEDAMLVANWHLAHSLLAQYLNVGLLHPREVCDAVETAYRAGAVPIASAEGFIRQVIGWREYVWGVYWLWGEQYAELNELGATRPLPPVFTGQATTRMRCVDIALRTLHDHAWVHHIQRLMVLGNLALLAGVSPQAMTRWMWTSFVDGAEWVMTPNVIGMALYADGGLMATKPYAAGGAYIDRMSDSCTSCQYDRTKRTGPDACPFTVLYWDFLARHEERFVHNPRVVRQARAAQRLSDLPATRGRAAEMLRELDAGTL